MSTDLVVFRHDGIACSVTQEAVSLRDAVLERSALVGSVRNAIQNEAAIGAMKDIRSILKRIEDARKSVKEPVLELGRRIAEFAWPKYQAYFDGTASPRD